MKKQWIAFVLTAIGAVVVGLWIFRKINPAPRLNQVPSGGAGVQSTAPGGFRLDDPVSTIQISPSVVTPVSQKNDWDIDFVDSLPKL